MGNDQSTVIDEERKMLESLYQISEGRLDNNDANHVNSKVNAGTSAPNCQPSHTIKEIKKNKEEEERKRLAEEVKEAERLAGLLDINDSQHQAYLEAQKKMERLNSESSNNSNGRNQQQQAEKGSIGSYVQMAKTGYQELVNAIIR